jgi:uncharacterized protein YggT (Ycf19 family)
MSQDHTLAAEEDRRRRQHDAIKSDVSQRVQDDVARETTAPMHEERGGTEALAGSLKQKAVREVASTEAQIQRGGAAARVSQIVDYVFFLIYGLIALSILLEALGARESAGFARFITAVTSPLLAPFQGLLRDPSVGGSQFMISYVVALVVYAMLHAAINGALRMVAHRKTEV